MYFDQLKRREFITLLGGAGMAWPLVARAQQDERMRRIGVLMPLAADDPEAQIRLGAFLQGLQQLGWAIGRNLRVDFRWGAGNVGAMRKYAAELVALTPDVLLGPGTTPVGPLLEATRTVPIVFVHVVDPVGAGFVASLARPGGNATGFVQFEYGISGQMAGAAEADRPGSDARRGHSGCLRIVRDRSVRRHPVRGPGAPGGGEPDECARR
jgi:putative tryptophan/tyrosine transport system substrate-binding protein